MLYDENAANLYGVRTFPTTLFIDREGNVRYRVVGLDSDNAKRNLEFIITELMNKTE